MTSRNRGKSDRVKTEKAFKNERRARNTVAWYFDKTFTLHQCSFFCYLQLTKVTYVKRKFFFTFLGNGD